MAAGASSSSHAYGFSISAVLLASSFVCLFGSGEASGAAHRVVDPEWHPATATWYGSAEGDGSDGNTYPHGSMFNSHVLRPG
jgi:hypothetical protein